MAAVIPSSQSTVGVFGYLPGQADFVRVRAAGREVRRLEEWLERGLHQARWEMGGGFTVTYPRLFHRFVYRPDNAEKAVLGVLCASVDSHGRPFPFVAFQTFAVAAWDLDPASVLGLHAEFFAQLEELVRKVGSLAHIGQVHGCVDSVRAISLNDGEGAAAAGSRSPSAQRYQNFLQETQCQDLGVEESAPGLAILYDMEAALGGGEEPRLFRSSVALPLSRPAFARDLELQFYVAFIRSLLSRHRPTLSAFWQLGHVAAGSLLVCFREPVLELFGALLTGGVGSRNVYRPGTGISPLPRPRPDLTGITSLELALQPNKRLSGNTVLAKRNGAQR